MDYMQYQELFEFIELRTEDFWKIYEAKVKAAKKEFFRINKNYDESEVDKLISNCIEEKNIQANIALGLGNEIF